MDRKTHWQGVYSSKSDDELSWHQPDPQPSLDLIIEAAGVTGRVIDVGGGSSSLAAKLLDNGFKKVAVLDISTAALDRARLKLGARAGRVEWIVADVTTAGGLGEFDVWHDRAVFHFLTEAVDRAKYVQLVLDTLVVGGHLIIGTFAFDGPARCSGLDVVRYDASSLCSELGDGFELIRELGHIHLTPGGKPQPFVYGVFRRGH